eukprot:CAMPEP_0174845424 /NCGR_PEP_ID=MMETSP1114-20130205/11718_1 /TAXON_ID=312471 /ORGANISM="Neobodo designis, Strain CCAP 1951/1" /LENGTH=181 /DNA_ID=CAMNT_0016079669 /DNA_START=57 /DNA_END=600 /DNA_ORIENTATION=+
MADKCEEIKRGGINGCLGLDQVDWGGKGGKIWECWILEPCCGSPANLKDAGICLLTWICCPLCAHSKLFSSSLGAPCALFPQVLFAVFCSPLSIWFLRYNLRSRHGVHGNLCGDLVCVYFLSLCAFLQHLRSVSVSQWELVPVTIEAVGPMKVIEDTTAATARGTYLDPASLLARFVFVRT